MKLTSIIKKNFKLLIRSKASAFTVLIGPLLIILLVGLAFSGKTSYELSIGYYAPTHNNLTESFIQALKQSHYYVQEFGDEQSCVKKIEQGIIHTCVVFPRNFQISNEQTNKLRFLVDYSRMNLVYKIIDSVSDILEIQTKELSYSLTQVLLSKINTTLHELNQDLLIADNINPKLNLLTLDIQRARANAESMKLSTRKLSLTSLNTHISSLNTTIESVKEKNLNLINKTQEYLEILVDDGYWDENESEQKEEELEKLVNKTLALHNTTSEEIQRLVDSVKSISSSLSKLESDLNLSKQLNEDTKTRLDSAKNNLGTIQTNLLDLKNALNKSKQNLESIAVTRAETIVSPVNTIIEPVVSETSKLTFTFPFLLILVIMFVALLLSSTLIIFEKNSKAFFRNFITPTRSEFFVITTALTSFIVIIVQTMIILGLANYFLHIPLFKNALSTLLIIFVTTLFFIVLGMAIGYLFSTQEGAIMASIILSSVFLFLSNLVVPLETLAPALSGVIKYNPYVLASELLRKALLFKITTLKALVPLLILFGASIIIFLLIMLFHGITHMRRIKPTEDMLSARVLQEAHSSSRPPPEEGVIRAVNKLELLKVVSNMTKAQFEDYVGPKQNKIADWVEKKIRNKKLAHKLRRTISKKEIMRILIEDIKKEEKRAKKD